MLDPLVVTPKIPDNLVSSASPPETLEFRPAIRPLFMRLFHWFLIAVFTTLQSVAPLLHVHVQSGPNNGSGLHMSGMVPNAWADGHASASGAETRAIDACDQSRRLQRIVTADAVPTRLAIVCSAADERKSPQPGAQSTHLPGRTAFRQPPALAPPVLSA